MENSKQELKKAIGDSIDNYEAMLEANQEKMAEYHRNIEGLKESNTYYLEQIRLLTKKLREL